MTIQQIRQELKELDHDCRQPYEPCTTCYHIENDSDEELIKLWKNIKGGE